MKPFPSFVRLISLPVLALAACTATPAATEVAELESPPEMEEGGSIVLGDITDDPAEVIEGTQPLADYLAERLGDYGITRGEVHIAASADEMAQLLRDGDVDLYFDSAYPATLIVDASGGQPILRRWRRGVDEYHTVIFASAESGIDSLEDLPGNIIAFDNAFSTSGFVLPAVYLIEERLTLTGKQSYNDPVADDEVGFVFSFDDENTIQWVASGLVAAGATDNVSYEFFPEEARESFVILGETESVPRQMVVARPGIDDDLLEALIDLLTSAHENDEGRAALEDFGDTTRIDEFPEGVEATLERMRELAAIVEDITLP